MLLFDRAAPRGSRLLPVGPNQPTSPVKTWATVDPVGTRRIVVLNKDAYAAWFFKLKPADGGAYDGLLAPKAYEAVIGDE